MVSILAGLALSMATAGSTPAYRVDINVSQGGQPVQVAQLQSANGEAVTYSGVSGDPQLTVRATSSAVTDGKVQHALVVMVQSADGHTQRKFSTTMRLERGGRWLMDIPATEADRPVHFDIAVRSAS